MPSCIISDTSCLILLSKIGHLSTLEKVYQEVLITPEIQSEYGEALPDFIQVRKVKALATQRALQQQVDIGEASALALALENSDPLLIVDDKQARRLADQLGVAFTGTLGILVRAKQSKQISSLKDVLEQIQKTDFRISERLINLILKQVGES